MTGSNNARLISLTLCILLITACGGSSTNSGTVLEPSSQAMEIVQTQFDSLSTTTSTINTGDVVFDIPNTDEFEQVPFTVNRIEIESVLDADGKILLSTVQPFRITIFVDDLIELENESNGVRAVFVLENPEMNRNLGLQSAYHSMAGGGSTSFAVFCRVRSDETQQLIPSCNEDFTINGVGSIPSEFDLNNLILVIQLVYEPESPEGNTSVNRFGVYNARIPISIMGN